MPGIFETRQKALTWIQYKHSYLMHVELNPEVLLTAGCSFVLLLDTATRWG